MDEISNECPICLELFIGKKTIITFDCQHEVHLYCINEWKYNNDDCSEIYKCILCNENKEIINIQNPVVYTVYNIDQEPEILNENNIRHRRQHIEIDNSCRGFFSAVRSFFRRLFNL